MEIKKIVLVFVIICLALSCAFGANVQQTYTTRDEVYIRVDKLCQRAGVLGPSSFSPVTGRVLEIALNRIKPNELSAYDQRELEELYEILLGGGNYLYAEEYMKFDLELSASLQSNLAKYSDFDFVSYGDGSRHDLVRLEEVMTPYRYDEAAISVYPKFYFGDHVFLESVFSVKNNNSRLYESNFGWLFTDYNGFSFFGNKPYTAYAPELPYRAGLSAGNNYFSFILGRYPHSIGAGITGNMGVGDNFIYQEIANASFLSNFFTYNISVTRFDVVNNNTVNTNTTTPTRQEYTGPQQFRVIHRFDFNFFDRVRFALDLGTVYESDFGFDMRFFYPFVIHHNYYNYTNYVDKTDYDEANNMMTFYLDVALPYGLRLTSQFVLDQLQTYFEDKKSVPMAYGVLANLSYSKNISNGVFNAYFEGAYTNPYLYLNGKATKSDSGNDIIDYNLDYFVGYHVQYLSDYRFSGYRFGPDSLVFATGVNYESNDAWTVGFDLLYKAQGGKRVRYSVTDVKETHFDMSNAYIERDPNQRASGVLSTGLKNAEHLIQIKINGSYEFERYGILIYGSAALNSYFNYDLVIGAKKFSPVFSLGVKYSY